MDILSMYANRDKHDLTAYFGQFVSEPRVKERYKLSFSCNQNDYFEILQKYSFSDRHRCTIIRGVQSFIDSCLILGKFLHDVSHYPLSIFNYNCITEFNLTGIVDCQNRNEIQHKFINLWVTIRTITLDGMISIDVLGHNDSCPTYTEVSVLCPHNLYICCPPTIKIKRIPETDKYQILDKVFIPPQYRKLPLYINDVFIRDYVREMFKNPPPPPPQYYSSKTFSYL